MQEQNLMPFTYHTCGLSSSGTLSLSDASGHSGLPSFHGNLQPSLITMMNDSLLSPAQITGSSPGFFECERLVQSMYERQCQVLKDDLAQAKEQYNTLWYTPILSISVSLIIEITGLGTTDSRVNTMSCGAFSFDATRGLSHPTSTNTWSHQPWTCHSHSLTPGVSPLYPVMIVPISSSGREKIGINTTPLKTTPLAPRKRVVHEVEKGLPMARML